MDSVDNTLDLLSHWVTEDRDQRVNTPHEGGCGAEKPDRATERDRTAPTGAVPDTGSPTAPGDNAHVDGRGGALSTGGGSTGGAHSAAVDADRSRPPEPSEAADSGRDLAHAALKAAQDRAKTRGHEPGRRQSGNRPPGKQGQTSQNPRRRRWSGAGADERDPQSFGRIAARMATQFGWSDRLAGGHVFGRWATLVGEDVAEHAQPVSLTDGELVVRASSTAWATQLRLLQRQLLAKIASGVGHGVVKRMKIQGPAAPSWRKGPRHVSGRGPRDTYG
ncbi:Protein of unknown function (DUF721) [Prauserella alba]|nr:Protein of unknown function (DUF721) [Prauserella alba]